MRKITTNSFIKRVVLLGIVLIIQAFFIAVQFDFFAATEKPTQNHQNYKTWDGWQLPQCQQISGVKMLAFFQNNGEKILFADKIADAVSENENITLSNAPAKKEEPDELSSITPLHTPNTLLAIYNGNVVISTDAGCTWNKTKNLEAGEIVVEPNGGAYIFTNESSILRRYRPSLVYFKDNQIVNLRPPLVETKALVVNSSNPKHLRAAGLQPLDEKGQIIKLSPPNPNSSNINGAEKYDSKRVIVDSTDGGNSWKIIARYPLESFPETEIVINPANPDQIILPNRFGEKSLISFDGGKNWQKTNRSVYSPVFHPTDNNIAWALGYQEIDIPASHNTSINSIIDNSNHSNTEWNVSNMQGNTNTHWVNKKEIWGIYYSNDGGRTFTLEIEESNAISHLGLINLYPYPSNPEILYYATKYSLIKYDRKNKSMLTKEISYPISGRFTEAQGASITEMIFSPADSSMIYIGFRKEFPVY